MHVWNWLNANTGAVQALAAAVTAGLTAVLIGVTARYVVLTRRMLESSDAATRAGFMPDISVFIDFTHPRRNELVVHIKNTAEPPICVIRGRLVAGSIFKWSEKPGEGPQFVAEFKFAPTEIKSVEALFLRKDEQASGTFTVHPIGAMTGEEWLKVFDYRISLHATVVLEVSDITQRILYSFTVRRNAHKGGATSIQTRYPSIFETEVDRFENFIIPVYTSPHKP